MAENKQNTETKNTTGGAASAKQAKEENQTPSKTTASNESAADKNVTETASAVASETVSKVKETVGDAANQVIGQAKEKAGSVLDEQKTNLATGVAGVADSIRQVGDNLSSSNEGNQVAAFAGKYGDTLAQQVERFSSYIDDKDIREIARDVEQFARRNPIVFVGGAFALGILAARFLKSSGGSASGKRAANKNS